MTLCLERTRSVAGVISERPHGGGGRRLGSGEGLVHVELHVTAHGVVHGPLGNQHGLHVGCGEVDPGGVDAGQGAQVVLLIEELAQVEHQALVVKRV